MDSETTKGFGAILMCVAFAIPVLTNAYTGKGFRRFLLGTLNIVAVAVGMFGVALARG